jgi:hypothetical protein
VNRTGVLRWSFVVSVAALITHTYGYWFAVGNQMTYMTEPLHRVHPELFRNDWLVSTTTNYHRMFTEAASWLYRWDDSGVTSTAIAHFVVMVLTIVAMYLVITALVPRYTIAIFAIVLGWLAIDGDRSLAGSYIWAGYLQPSSIATAGWIFALAAFLRRMPLATGIALALAGLVHANFLIIGVPLFATAELAMDRAKPLPRLAKLLVPQLVVAFVLAPDILAAADQSDPDLALWVLTRFHAPLHYLPRWIVHGIPGFARWPLLALAVAPVALAGSGPAIRRLIAWYAIGTALCLGVLVLAMIPPLLPLTRLYVWRAAPFVELAAQIVVATAVASGIDDPARWRALPVWRRYAAVGLAGFTIAYTIIWPHTESSIPLIVVGAGVAVAFVVRASHRVAPIAVVAASVLIYPIHARWYAISESQIGVDTTGPDAEALYAWARDHTPVDAEFVVPLDLRSFRLLARRAVYVDLKSPPLRPDELVAWYRRICRLVGIENLKHIPQSLERWKEMTGEELIARAHELGATYVVIDRPTSQLGVSREPVYANDSYTVYQLP